MSTSMPTPPNDQQPYTNYIPLDDNERDNATRQPKSAIHLLSPIGPASIANHALYHVINLAFNNPPSYTIPIKLNNSTNMF
jgi:hypothetical protein